MMLSAGLSAGFTSLADMAWEVKCRQEDMRQRAIDNERRLIDDSRRAVDEKAEQLKTVSQISALLAGFAMVIMVEINLPNQISIILLTIYAITSSFVVGLMLLCTLNCTMMLIAILKYDCINRPMPFHDFWLTRCESDWRFAYRCFSWGVPLFMTVLAQMGWITFQKYSDQKYSTYSKHGQLSRDVPACTVTFVALSCLALWYTHTSPKWSQFNLHSSRKFVV
ncbi:calcium release-activated calcium channel protein [Pelagophyceae sp. CCMP2097]|nr:calcium release-activated calcium channel protein [Pelagophyceae sp. CCMP2097]